MRIPPTKEQLEVPGTGLMQGKIGRKCERPVDGSLELHLFHPLWLFRGQQLGSDASSPSCTGEPSWGENPKKDK